MTSVVSMSGSGMRGARRQARASKPAVSSRSRIGTVLVAVLLGGCGDDDGARPALVPDVSLPGVFSGVFPCDGCPGIRTTLWLRPDGRCFLQQHYPADNDREAMDAYSLGRWRRTGDDGTVELGGAGPRRSFTPEDMDALLMQTESPLEHRLIRDPATPPFTASIRMAGMMRLSGGTASFTECWTGFVAPIGKSREYTRLLHQFRSTAARGQPAYVELEGRFSWSDTGAPKAIIIDRFVTVRSGETC